MLSVRSGSVIGLVWLVDVTGAGGLIFDPSAIAGIES